MQPRHKRTKKSIGFVESIESSELKGNFLRGDAVKRVPKIKKTVHGKKWSIESIGSIEHVESRDGAGLLLLSSFELRASGFQRPV